LNRERFLIYRYKERLLLSPAHFHHQLSRYEQILHLIGAVFSVEFSIKYSPIYRVSQKVWNGQYFANIFVHSHCWDLILLPKDSFFNSPQNLYKIVYCENWMWNIRGWRL
jgi:hypothetical protein